MHALITGGGGFVGAALAHALLTRGDAVRILARGDYPDLRAAGAETVRGDLVDAAAVSAACVNVDVVFHVAAKVGYHGPAALYEQTNVVGTQNVLDACRARGVRRLVFTSTPSVVHRREGCSGIDESTPYPQAHVADYPRTKAEAERRVMAADRDGLRTVSLRPRGVWGPGDTNLFPMLVRWARAGQLRRIGNDDPLQHFSYIDDVVDAHLLAEARLRDAPERVGGKTYFIASAEPIGAFTMIDRVLACADLPGPTRRVPLAAASMAAVVIEHTWRWFGISAEPRLTRYKLDVLTRPCWFDLSAAQRDLGYRSSVPLETGLERLRAWALGGGLRAPGER